MVRLPAALERRLQELFPRVRERERFIAKILEEALVRSDDLEEGRPEAVGGTLHLFTDGGSRGNPGHAAIGCILEDPVAGKVLREYHEHIGVETNNVAEYRALIEGLKIALQYRPNHLICHLDSELVVRQVNGQYQVRMPTLQPLMEEVKELAQQLGKVTFSHIPRADNYRADSLVNKALDEFSASSNRRGR
jgi:ribonuclease HI